MWDAASYYRHYDLAWADVASHCRSWVGPEGATTLVDLRMMFGCRAAANWAQRGTGFLTWVLQTAMGTVVPDSASLREACALLEGAGLVSEAFRLAYVSCFIDDQPWLTVQSMARPMMAIAAALWKVLGIEPQGKKVWFEGLFSTK